MELSHTAAVSLHQKLVVMFTKKLAPIPKLSFMGERKPTLDDYYKLNDACFPARIPMSVSLPYCFDNYNLFASNEFSGCKFEGRFDIARATWFWSLDKTHTFSRQSSQALVNFLLAAIVLAKPEDPKNKQLIEFIHKFRVAFVAYNFRVPEFDDQEGFLSFWYHNTRYDLIEFSNRTLKKIFRKIKELKHGARLQDPALFSQYAVVWAVQWLVDMKKDFEWVDDMEKGHNASARVFEDGLAASLAGIGMNNDLPTYLTQEHFTRPETQALLKDIEEIKPADEKHSVMWMDPKAAADRILNSDLSAMLQKMKL
ncbi:hypothetical protein P171DRAFT_443935 [Karstenula rhodostoma CBS 690.94]|uniref:Uncharacterized protein n=1 Tax=Karstenula rhodostoma CBS 690.94 TaxID=1392251 RepID=A0A9P4PJ95_9PLEO|nr:hypothetical protein P171DRAFT_443935 [Karstenula rhodostoma CBS 690.94]